jgi:hypothetical protein
MDYEGLSMYDNYELAETDKDFFFFVFANERSWLKSLRVVHVSGEQREWLGPTSIWLSMASY